MPTERSRAMTERAYFLLIVLVSAMLYALVYYIDWRALSVEGF